ncbi:hypothetical protein ACN47E_005871 [Coniothyrium glycines]
MTLTILKGKSSSRKSATILREVPDSPGHGTALHSDKRDITTHAYQHFKDVVQSSAGGRALSLHLEVEDANSRPISKLDSIFSNAPLKGAIGTYNHGRIHWRAKEASPSQDKTNSIDRTPKPRIHVVIPSEHRNRPLPDLPFFANPKNDASATPLRDVHDVSPPSTSRRGLRDSIVSPLSQVQTPPMPFGRFQQSTSKTSPNLPTPAMNLHGDAYGAGGASSDSQESDASSVQSARSSRTSVEGNHTVIIAKGSIAQQHLSQTRVVNDYGIPPTMAPPRRYTHHTPIEDDAFFQRTCDLQPTRANDIARKPTLTRRSSRRGRPRRSLTPMSNMGVINEAISRSTSRQASLSAGVASPTLSQAEDELQEELTSFIQCEGSAQQQSSNKESLPPSLTQPRKDSGTLDVTEAPPAVPRKSSKRKSMVNARTSQSSNRPDGISAGPLSRAQSRTRNQGLKLAIPEYKRVTEEFILSPIEISSSASKCTITPGGAEAVILGILNSMDHFDDLFAAAVVNCGFYRVFKRHELRLIKSTLHRMSPAAWEYREIAYPGHEVLHAEDLETIRPDEEYTPTTYLQLHKRDVQTIRAIKLQIMDKCQSFLRPEVSFALLNDSPTESARVDNALWRIWSFCKIFGSGKAREEDLIAQIDWLKGGVLAHQDACTSSFMTTEYMNDTLLGAPESFGAGNEGGLTAEELFDMMELWNCLGVLLQGFEGRTADARQAGIYDCTDVRGGDIDGEEAMLDEWCYYLLTFGPSAILDLADPCRRSNNSAFVLAAENGWVNWKAPVFKGSRRNFLKEAASRIYEDKIAQTYAQLSTRDLQRQQSKIRIQQHISELRQRRSSGDVGPTVHMSQERPMSVWSTVMSTLTRPSMPTRSNDIASYIPALRSSLATDLSPPISELPAARTPSPSRRTVAQPLLPTPPPSTAPSNRDGYSIATSMPSIDEHPVYQRHNSIPEVPPLASHPAFRQGSIPFRPSPSNMQPRHIRHSSGSSVYSRNSSGSSLAEQPAFQQHQAQLSIYGSERYENTADKAIYRIVEMGFTAEQAREALRATDQGTGLRIDHAVELLLSRQM